MDEEMAFDFFTLATQHLGNEPRHAKVITPRATPRLLHVSLTTPVAVIIASMTSSPPPVPKSLAQLRASLPSYVSQTNDHVAHFNRSASTAFPPIELR